MNSFSKIRQVVSALLAISLMAPVLPAQNPPASPQKDFTFKVNTDLVLVNVVARDKKGNLVTDLKREDFTILEDNKAQQLKSFDLENTELAVLPAEDTPAAPIAPEVTPATKPKSIPDIATKPESGQYNNRRLMVLFFDFSGMEDEEVTRSLGAAKNYLDQQMTAADTVAIVTFSTALKVEQDFTSDRALLKKALGRLSGETGEGFETAAADTGSDSSFAADDSDFANFNTDRKLQALQSLAEAMAKIEQKKSIIYFSNGVSRNGLENQSQLRATVNAAVKANVAIYTMDVRGLQALPPGGDATQASTRGVAAFSGAGVRGQADANFASQETLSTLAGDTGGKAFLDSNDFGKIFSKVQADTSAYYVLSFRSTNPAMDGRYRKITVRLNRPDIKLEYRNGYYAGRDFSHSNKEDREAQLDKELLSDLPSTDVAVYLAASYFRRNDGQYYVPVSLIVPGSEIPFTRVSDSDKATLDVIGIVRDLQTRFPIGNVRETVKLNIQESQNVKRKNVQYNTGFILAPGSFHIKFVVRENQTGRIGSFETDINIPDLRKPATKNGLKMSSIVLGGQMQQVTKGSKDNPLIRDGQELIPNISHVFSSDQHLYMYYEVYDPVKLPKAKPAADKSAPVTPQGDVRLMTSVQFFDGKVKAFETPLVEVREITAPERRAAAFQLDVPLGKLKPGYYTCQVVVVDDAAGTFDFPRFALLVK